MNAIFHDFSLKIHGNDSNSVRVLTWRLFKDYHIPYSQSSRMAIHWYVGHACQVFSLKSSSSSSRTEGPHAWQNSCRNSLFYMDLQALYSHIRSWASSSSPTHICLVGFLIFWLLQLKLVLFRDFFYSSPSSSTISRTCTCKYSLHMRASMPSPSSPPPPRRARNKA